MDNKLILVNDRKKTKKNIVLSFISFTEKFLNLGRIRILIHVKMKWIRNTIFF